MTTTAGFAGLWLIPRLAGFTASHPDVDVRISANYQLVNLDRDGVDIGIRYHPKMAPAARHCACSVRWRCRCARRSCGATRRGR